MSMVAFAGFGSDPRLGEEHSAPVFEHAALVAREAGRSGRPPCLDP
jgi:hypothetical protein